jgi:hypothetical protein
VLLLAVPFTVAVGMFQPAFSELAIHLALGLGTLIVGLSVFDFAAPKSLTRIGCGAACALAAIFFGQALGALTHDETVRSIAYSAAIGGWGEAVTASLLMVWLIAVARTFGAGVTMLIGAFSALAVIGVSAWGTIASYFGVSPAELKLLLSLPVLWLLLVATRPRTDG